MYEEDEEHEGVTITLTMFYLSMDRCVMSIMVMQDLYNRLKVQDSADMIGEPC